MTKTSLIVGILKLGDKMDKSDGLESLMIIHEMEILCDEFLESNKL
ncbi:hypothetical protein [Tenacibaculum sp. 190524A05c]